LFFIFILNIEMNNHLLQKEDGRGLFDEKILANGLRYSSKNTPTIKGDTSIYSEACLIVPVGENHEGNHQSQSAHICEHFCSAFNGGFKKPYAFLDLRTTHNIRFNISTHEDYTLYHISHIPPTIIPDVINFLYGVFHLSPYVDKSAMQREIEIVRAENMSLPDSEGLVWAALYWIRQNGGKPSVDAIYHRGMPDKVDVESVLSFHEQYYKPSKCVLTIIRPEKYGMEWDKYLSYKMTPDTPLSIRSSVPLSAMISGGLTNGFTGGWFGGNEGSASRGCGGCSVLKGAWVIPDKSKWLVCTRFFPATGGKYIEAEIKARILIACSTRLTGAEGTDSTGNKSLVDYLRKDLGVSYSLKGENFRIKHNGIDGTIVIFSSPLIRHLTKQEAAMCVKIINNCRVVLPSRGDISTLLARYLTHSQPEIVKDSLKLARIPIITNMNWSILRRAYSTSEHPSEYEKEISSVIFSSE
jgi:hypothetical protein